MGWHFYRIWSTDWFRNRLVEQDRLINAIKSSFTNDAPTIDHDSKKKDESTYEESFRNKFDFDEYKPVDVSVLAGKNWSSYEKLIKKVVEVEGPISEELLLKRIVPFFGREKVTNYVWGEYWAIKPNLSSYGIRIKDGFLNLKENNSIRFRSGKSYVRNVQDIYPAELAAGILTILRHNVSVDKQGLYKILAEQCGYKRLTDNMFYYFDRALEVVKDKVKVDGDILTYIKNE